MKWIFIPSFFLVSFTSFAQDLPDRIQQQMEQQATARESESVQEPGFVQDLEYYQKHPLNINEASPNEIAGLHLLSAQQVGQLILYRKLIGKLIDIHELQSIPTWDITTINALLPYIYIGPSESVIERLQSRLKGDSRITLSYSSLLERPKGYDLTRSNHYLGSRSHLSFLYRYQYKDLLQWGLTADKDPGEQFFKGTQKNGFDFYSAYLFLQKWGCVRSLVIGDYTVSLGQGLVQWQSFAAGKSSFVLDIKRQSAILRPYRSASEANFNRGIGITFGWNQIQFTVFASKQKISGTYDRDSFPHFTSIITSGLHRTLSELANKNNIGQFMVGGNMGFHTGRFSWNLYTVRDQFSIPYQKRNEPYNEFAFAGTTSWNSGTDYSFTWKNMYGFGEAAVDKGGHPALIAGALVSLHPKVDGAIVYRNLSPHYQVLFGEAFTENSLPANEHGLYTGLVIRPATGWQLSWYSDAYNFPWLKYGVGAPSHGQEYLVQLSYQPSKAASYSLLFKWKDEPSDRVDGTSLRDVGQSFKTQIRFLAEKRMRSSQSLKARLELVQNGQANGSNSDGFLVYAEYSRHLAKFMKANLRIQYHQASDYLSRIYTHEQDILYAYSVPSFYNQGWHYYLNGRFSWNKTIQLNVKWSQTLYSHLNTFGSGLNEISGNKSTELKMQISVQF